MEAMQEDEWRTKALNAGKVFTPTTPINAQDLFAGRKKELRQIVDVIHQVGQHAILYGDRGVGKTSLANIVAAELGGPNVLAPRINCDSTDDFDLVWKKAIREAGLTQQQRSIGFKAGSSLHAMSPVDLLGEKATPDSVRHCLARIAEQFVPVFIIDEFDRLDTATRRALADTIKTLSDHAVPATILLVGVADNVDQLIVEHRSVQRALAQVHMPRMHPDELHVLLEKGVEKLGMTIQISAKRLITRLSQGMPHYTHLLALHACRAAIDDRSSEVTEYAVQNALERALRTAQQSILNSYETAVRSARKDNLFREVLLACAMVDANDLGEFSPQEIRGWLQQITGRHYEISSFAQHLKEFTEPKRGPVLQKIGISRLYRYKFIDPLLMPYVILRGISSRLIGPRDLE
jgi:Cdc6-like AAA superfamily ATPase